MLNPIPGFLGPSYILPSPNASCQRTLNLYSQALEATDKAPGMLVGAPGLAAPTWTLPTTPLRGLWAGGAPLSSGGRLFAAAGSKLYEVFLGSGTGTVTTVATAVTWVSGATFGPGMIGQPLTINSVVYTVATVPTMFSLTLTATAGTQATPVAYSAGALSYYTQRGDIGDDAAHSPVQMFPNGEQLFIVSAGNAYLDNGLGPVQPLYTVAGAPPYADLVIDATTNTKITSSAQPFTVADIGSFLVVTGGTGFTHQTITILSVNPATGVATANVAVGTVSSTGGVANQNFGPVTATTGAYLDTFFIVSTPSTRKFQVSAPDDGTSWDPADVASKESYPDNIGALLADHEELYLFGESKSEVWRAPGVDANFPYQRDTGACLSEGIAAPWSACSFIDGVAWIGASLRGQPVAYYAVGYQPERVSTNAIEAAWAKFATVADAVAFNYELDGHEFWQINFPTGDQTWVYDRTASKQFGKPMWFERSSLSSGAQHRHRACCHAYIFGKHWVGDFATGAIYEMSPTVYLDNAQVMTCQRVLPHMCADRLRQFFPKFQLELETAAGGAALTVVLDWSDDGGHSFVGGGSAFTWTTSTTKTQERVVFWQLGSADDRVFRITVTGNGRKALINAYLDSISGT